MNKTFNLLLLLLVLPVLAIAGDVQVFPIKGVDLSKFKTFTILPPRVLAKTGIVENDPVVSPLITAALRNELTKKGLTEVSANADVEVLPGALQVSVPQLEALIYDYTDYATLGAGPIASIGRYNKEGTLYVNLVDPRTKKSVWLGLAKRAMGKPSNLKGDVDKATQALFKKYPSLK